MQHVASGIGVVFLLWVTVGEGVDRSELQG